MNKIKQSIPEESVFKDREKEAKFWEENFNNELAAGKPVKASFAKNLSETVNIRLDPTTLTNLRKQAKAKGLGPTQLIRMWIMEKVNDKEASSIVG